MLDRSPLAYADSLRIGTVEYVSPSEIKVDLDVEAPDRVALNTGVPRAFPRVNGYVLIPSDEGFVVGQISWITVEPSPYPKRKGMRDFGLVDLPYPKRKMSLSPLGLLTNEEGTKDDKDTRTYHFQRGVESYPTVGDPVLIPTQSQLRQIVESGAKRRVLIGHSPLAANAEVKIDPDRLFGRHLAILGNTGSGKSCSVAGLIRWSLEAAREEGKIKQSNARFIVLDPNGEYSHTFDGLDKVRVFSVNEDSNLDQQKGTEDEGSNQVQQKRVENDHIERALQVPIWLWNTEEWSAFTHAGSGAQRPALIQALRTVREGVFVSDTIPEDSMRRYLRTLVSAVKVDETKGTPWIGKGPAKGFRDCLKVWCDKIVTDTRYSPEENNSLKDLQEYINSLLQVRTEEWCTPFWPSEIEALDTKLTDAYFVFGGNNSELLQLDADVPRFFKGDDFIKSIEESAERLNVTNYAETMIVRIRTLLSDVRMKAISGDDVEITLEQWLKDYIGDNKAINGSISVIDLSLVPAETAHIVAAVIARMTLEALQRYRRLNQGKTLPTVLVMEEAHNFIRRYQNDSDIQSAGQVCTQVFEKIAREGRKFGLGLVLSSQRPSELSQTVLSQCNSFLLHRISNYRDQELVGRLVPDNLQGLLRDLPALPAGQAILLGWASEIPVLVEMNKLAENEQPQSEDPDFWKVWSGEAERSVDWKHIADDWQQRVENETEKTRVGSVR